MPLRRWHSPTRKIIVLLHNLTRRRRRGIAIGPTNKGRHGIRVSTHDRMTGGMIVRSMIRVVVVGVSGMGPIIHFGKIGGFAQIRWYGVGLVVIIIVVVRHKNRIVVVVVQKWW